MKNLTKRFSSLFVVMALVLGMIVPVHAADNAKITISNPNTSISIIGNEYNVYQIYKLTLNLQLGAYSYTINPDFSSRKTDGTVDVASKDLPSVVAAAGIGYTATPVNSKTLLSFLEELKGNSSGLHAFSKVVNEFIRDNNLQPVESVTAGAETFDIPLDEYGYYIVEGSANATGDGRDDEEVIAISSLTSTDPCAIVKPKADVPKLEKEVEDVKDEDIDGHKDTEWTDHTDVNIGDTVNFKIKSTVPNMNGYTSYTYTVHDTMSKGLTFDPTSVKITIARPDGTDEEDITNVVSADATYYAVDATSVDGSDNTIDIDFLNFIKLQGTLDPDDPTLADPDNGLPGYKNSYVGWVITITYSAELNKHAVIASDPTDVIPNYNWNKAKLEYSSNPYDNGEPKTNETPETEVKVYTFDIDLLKVYNNGTKDSPDFKTLADAEFKLYKTLEAAEEAARVANFGGTMDPDLAKQEVKVIAVGQDTDGNNVYRVADTGETNYATSMITPSSGLLVVKGLDEGFYYFVETAAPDGFNLLEAPVKVGIKATYTDGTLTKVEYWDIDPETLVEGWKTSSTYTPQFVVENKSGKKLPETGGIGRTIFTIAGSGMMLAAAVVMIAKRKTRFE